MTPEAQRIAIAEACGWANVRESEIRGFFIGDAPIDYEGPIQFFDENNQCVPDYTGDLNACHEMEKVLLDSQVESYMRFLFSATAVGRWPDTPCAMTFSEGFQLSRATAVQRCEAFLRCLNLWTE